MKARIDTQQQRSIDTPKQGDLQANGVGMLLATVAFVSSRLYAKSAAARSDG